MNGAAVDIKNLEKTFGTTEVLKGIDLAVKPGEFLVLVGASGCGKSTLLRMIAGLETPTTGDIQMNGNSVVHLEPKDRRLAMVFQSYALYPHLTVYENMAFGLRMEKQADDEIERRMKSAAELLQITHLLQRKPKQLSGGQRQRVALGRALVKQSPLILFDEPLSNLDAKLRNHMRTEIKRIHQKLGNTMIYVTHDQIEATTMGDRIAVMRGGLIEQLDTPLNIYRYPKTRFVAGFIGTPEMNFVEGHLVQESGQNIFSAAGFRCALQQMKFANENLVLGIRPEDIRLTTESTGAEGIAAKVELCESLGATDLLHLQIGDNSVKTLVPADHPYKAGDTVHVEFAKYHVFDGGDGRRYEMAREFQ